MAHVAVTIVTWNSMRYLPEALASIAAQTFGDYTLIIVDNASTDGVIEFVREHHPKTVVLRNSKNLGFARGHNQAIAYARARLRRVGEELHVLVTNPDIIMEPEYLATVVDQVERRPEVGSAVGKLLKVFSSGEGELREGVKSDLIDSAGLRVHKSRLVTERGAGEKDGEGPYDRTEEIFGVTGALGLYRLSALEDVMIGDECFDEEFFAYKEDIDLAWRLRLRGWASLYVPRARAYHYRTASGDGKVSLWNAPGVVKARHGRSSVINFYSYRNHLLTLAKNEHVANALTDLPRIAWNETKKFGYYLFTQPSSLRALPSFVRHLPAALGKRRRAMSRAKVRAGEMRKWFA